MPEIVFNNAPEVEAIARELISKYHGFLAQYKIAYAFREGSWQSRGRQIMGKATKLTAAERYLSGYDLLVVIDKVTWWKLDQEQKIALVDHELSHFSLNDEGNVTVVGHDVEDFVSVVARHGLWCPDLKKLRGAVHDYQITIFDDDDENIGNEDDKDQEMREAS